MTKLRRPGQKRPAQPVHRFTLRFEGSFVEVAEDLLDALYEMRCEDCVVGVSEGVLRITFSREAPNFRIALISAVTDIERSGIDLVLEAVERA
jgi:hypothetical protein